LFAAEIRTRSSPLAHFEFGILFADDVELAFALYDLAILAPLLDGCSYFHCFVIVITGLVKPNPVLAAPEKSPALYP
jgi:hypothetical protein